MKIPASTHSFKTTLLGTWAEAQAYRRYPRVVRRLAREYGMPLTVANRIAELGNIGPREGRP